MIIVPATTTSDRVFKIIPRQYYADVTVCIRDDQTNTESCEYYTGTEFNTADVSWELADFDWDNAIGTVLNESNDDFMIITIEHDDFTFREGHFYDFKVTNDDTQDVIYKDKIFCTDQDVDELTNDYYTINKDQYIFDTSNDDEVIIF